MPSKVFRAVTKGGPTMPPMLPDSVVPRAKSRVRFLQGLVVRSLRVAPARLMLAQLVGRALAGTPVKPLEEMSVLVDPRIRR